MEKWAKLEDWLSRDLEEDLEDYRKVMEKMGVDNVDTDIVNTALKWKQKNFEGIFGRETRIWKTIKGSITVPTKDDIHREAFDASLGLSARHEPDRDTITNAVYAINTLLNGRFLYAPENDKNWKYPTMEELVKNRYEDGRKVIRYLTSLIPSEQEKLRYYFEMLLSSAIGKFKQNDMLLVWSINPLDLLLCSEAGITSCLNLVTGIYRASAVAYSTDEVTSIMYTTRDLRKFERLGIMVPKKLHRSLVYYRKDAAASLQRMYPTMDNAVLKEMDKMIRKETGFAGAEYIYLFNNSEISYIDSAIQQYAIDQDASRINFIADGACPVCGNDLDSPGSLVCSCCDDDNFVTCTWCEERIPEEDAFYLNDENPYCERCAEHLAVCAECGTVNDREFMYYTPDGEVLCEECFEQYYEYCSSCYDSIPKDDAHYVSQHEGDSVTTRVYCEDCFHEVYDYLAKRDKIHDCDTCTPEMREASYTEGNEFYCYGCLHKLTACRWCTNPVCFTCEHKRLLAQEARSLEETRLYHSDAHPHG